MHYANTYIPPTLTVDAVIFQLTNHKLEVMLIKRSNAPFKGSWALPGGYNPAGETTKEALRNIVNRKAGTDVLKNLRYIEQLYTFDTVARDPRGHAVSVTYMGCGTNIAHSGGSEETSFFAVDELPPLAYDHQKIIAYARERLAAKLTYTNAVYGLLQPKFTLTELQKSYEAVFGRELDKRNFRKKFLSLNLIKETNEISKSGAHRPARLFEFNSKSLDTLSRSFD
ncbi:NUDIX hydrolase [Candidatus Saccharibacteria bacterium]|nr:MAG: NUDIX hydrolase [Candidatus Saccharibacteria bacterium]